MAVSMLEEKLAKNLECAICLDTFDDPRMLKCQHSYCKKCLEKIVIRAGHAQKITCPECREDMKLPRGGVASLQSSFLINDLLNLSLNTGIKSNESPLCDKHHEEFIELYCEICDEPICQACLVIDHRDHKHTSIKDVFPSKKREMARLMNEAKPKISALRAEVSAIEDEENKTRNNALTVSQEIDTFVDTLINKHTAILERERQRLKQEVSEQTSLYSSKLHDHKEALVVSLSSVEFDKQTLDCTNKVEFLRSKKEITDKITELRSLTEEFCPCEKVVYKLDKTVLEDENMKKIGQIKLHTEYRLGMLGGEPGVLYTGRARQRCDFVITTNSEETAKPHHRIVMDHIKVTILAPNADNPFSPSLNNEEDGSRTFGYRPECSGDYRISIINEKLFGGKIHSSPVAWKVLPALHQKSWLDWFFTVPAHCTYLSDCKFEEGQHSWRVYFPSSREQGPLESVSTSLQMGVVHPLHSDSFWYWSNGQHISSNSSHDSLPTSSIKSVCYRDLLTFFLDLDKMQLTVFNNRTKESDTWRGIKAPVRPFISDNAILWDFDFC